MPSAILIINSPFRGLGGLVAMSLPLNPLKGTYKEFTSDIYSKKADNENCWNALSLRFLLSGMR